MLDVQEREEAKGHRIPMKSIAQYAHPLWVKLSPAEKQMYEERANMYKNNPQFQGKKFASDGTLIEQSQETGPVDCHGKAQFQRDLYSLELYGVV
ncbi:hypothetical protein TNCV_88631 [Trichonephila clavipes]|nr:hypothetical protein TNCV_88631 [Trichonephila clavipes]